MVMIKTKYLVSLIVVSIMINVPACHADTIFKSSVDSQKIKIDGIWKIFKVPSISTAEDINKDNLPEQLNKKIEFNSGKFIYTKNFLFFPKRCERKKYSITKIYIKAGDIPPAGSLNFFYRSNEVGGYGPLHDNMISAVNLYCNGKFMTRFEIAKGGFLAIYWDYGFYYLHNASIIKK